MAQKPLNRITVAEVMLACGMARQHFYCRFEDLCDAVRRMFDREAIALLRKHEGVILWEDGLPQLFQYLRENRTVYLWALRSMSRERLKRFFHADIQTIIQNTIRGIVSEPQCQVSGQEPALLTKFYVGAPASVVEDRLLGEIRESPEELIRFVDQLLKDHVRGAAPRLSGPGAKTEPSPDETR